MNKLYSQYFSRKIKGIFWVEQILSEVQFLLLCKVLFLELLLRRFKFVAKIKFEERKWFLFNGWFTVFKYIIIVFNFFKSFYLFLKTMLGLDFRAFLLGNLELSAGNMVTNLFLLMSWQIYSQIELLLLHFYILSFPRISIQHSSLSLLFIP